MSRAEIAQDWKSDPGFSTWQHCVTWRNQLTSTALLCHKMWMLGQTLASVACVLLEKTVCLHLTWLITCQVRCPTGFLWDQLFIMNQLLTKIWQRSRLDRLTFEAPTLPICKTIWRRILRAIGRKLALKNLENVLFFLHVFLPPSHLALTYQSVSVSTKNPKRQQSFALQTF